MPALEPGAKLPPLALRDERGAAFPLPHAETLYAVFKTTCPTCELTWPYLDRIRRAAEGGGLRVIAVSQDPEGPTRAFGERLGTRLETVYDREPWAASDALGVANVPTLLHVEPDGRIAETIVGFDRARLEALAARAAALAGRPPAPLFHPHERVPALKAG
ncbi:MAG TPA: TlpA disulfide reductase family protein [Thermoanaerobaculia bacterium]